MQLIGKARVSATSNLSSISEIKSLLPMSYEGAGQLTI